jgi:hypothetical protein
MVKGLNAPHFPFGRVGDVFMNKKAPLFEFETFTVHKAQPSGFNDFPRKHNR